jgi:glucose-6-phosphate 1-dehydrogenase
MAQAVTAPLTQNILRDGLILPRTPDPAAMVIFGASGDLTARKLMPALYNLALNRYLPSGFSVIGVADTAISEDEFRSRVADAVQKFSRTQPVDRAVWQSVAEGISYVRMPFDDDGDGYRRLAAELDRLDRERGTNGNRVFYLATAPQFFSVIIDRLGASGIAKTGEGWKRVVIEKPFGNDLKSAQALNQAIHAVFTEQQIYRIDHYLGKETVQNVLVFRFANGIFEPIWNRRYVDHVQITVAEDIGIERRGKYYEGSGALRDIFQNHLMQLLSIAAMEAPPNFDADSVRDEKVKVLKSIHPIDVATDVVRGQYGPGWVGGQEVPGYRQELNVSPTSNTETFVAVRLKIDNWRWADTPFYLRTGKRLPSRASEIAIQFKNPPHLPFAKTAVEELTPNWLVMRIQPHEGASLKIAAKIPGPVMRLRTVNMDFFYGSSFMVESPDAYERLVLDCLLGDATLFAREDEVERAWALVDRIEAGWASQPPPPFPSYGAGDGHEPEPQGAHRSHLCRCARHPGRAGPGALGPARGRRGERGGPARGGGSPRQCLQPDRRGWKRTRTGRDLECSRPSLRHEPLANADSARPAHSRSGQTRGRGVRPGADRERPPSHDRTRAASCARRARSPPRQPSGAIVDSRSAGDSLVAGTARIR